jgi:hypothetical protein
MSAKAAESPNALAPLSLAQLTREAVELHELLTDLELAEEKKYDEALHEFIPPDQTEIAACRGLLRGYMTALSRKVDSVAQYIHMCQTQAQRAREEESRAWRWAKRWEAREKRLKDYVRDVILGLNLAKPRLEGVVSRLRVQQNSQAAVVFAEGVDAVATLPSEYLDVTIRISVPLYAAFQQFAADLGVLEACSQQGRAEVNLTRVAADLSAGVKIEGASLVKSSHLRVE